jgi:hypothetical protein
MNNPAGQFYYGRYLMFGVGQEENKIQGINLMRLAGLSENQYGQI